MTDVVGIASPATSATAGADFAVAGGLSAAAGGSTGGTLVSPAIVGLSAALGRAGSAEPLAGSLVALVRGGRSLIGPAYSIACIVKCAQTTRRRGINLSAHSAALSSAGEPARNCSISAASSAF